MSGLFAKIIAIVDQDKVVKGFDYTLTEDAQDFFADPEDRKKYKAIVLKHVGCESMGELHAQFRTALTYLRVGAALTTKTWNEDTDGTIGGIGYPIPHGCKLSPQARGELVFGPDGPQLMVVDTKLRYAEYKIGDRVELCINNQPFLKFNSDNNPVKFRQPYMFWVIIVAMHTDPRNHLSVTGQRDNGILIEFKPENVIQHNPLSWIEPKPFVDDISDSDSDDCKAFPDWLFPKVKIIEQQNDAVPPVTAPTPEPSASVQPLPQPQPPPALQEQSGLPLPPTLQRHRRYHPI